MNSKDIQTLTLLLIGLIFVMCLPPFFEHALDMNSDPTGCGKSEVYVEYGDRDTCYPRATLPPELLYYLDGAAND